MDQVSRQLGHRWNRNTSQDRHHRAWPDSAPPVPISATDGSRPNAKGSMSNISLSHFKQRMSPVAKRPIKKLF